MSERSQIGLIGLAVMGQNLALNIERNGFPIAVYNRTRARTEEFMAQRAGGLRVQAAFSAAELAGMLERPRRVLLMVKAGLPVDEMLDELLPHLTPGDIVIDGGNSFFADTERRHARLRELGLHYVGMGVSGGEEGALWGPSLMPGGPREAYDALEPVLRRIAAQVDDGPCCTYIGPGGAGHFVKMVHNGIEYGDMQLIAEAYDVLGRVGRLDPARLSAVFGAWNQGELSSFLIEITARVLAKTDEETGRPLVDLILDKAGQKGTGKWTSQVALDLGIAIPTINAAVEARILSAFKEERVVAAPVLPGPARGRDIPPGETARLVDAVRATLYASKICSYAQGLALLRAASLEHGWALNMTEIARIWKGGCIIRARLLGDIQAAFRRDAALSNLLIDPSFRDAVASRQAAWRDVVELGVRAGIPLLATAASLGYYDSYRSARLPANLIQAQRDLFGAHTYERVDRSGVFHTEW